MRFGARLAFSVGAATLALLPAWDAVMALPPALRDASALGQVLGATIGLTICLLLALTTPASRWRGLLFAALILLMGLLAFETAAFLVQHLKSQVEVHAGADYATVRLWAIATLALLAILLVILVWRRGWRAPVAWLRQGVTMLASLPAVFLVSHLIGLGASPPTASAGNKARQLTLVLVMDELDGRMIDRYADRLPNLQALRRTALSASAMYPPANYTAESLPGMLTGVDYEYTAYTRSEIHLLPAGQTDWLRMSQSGSLLSDAMQRGDRVDVVGWHLPYCSVFHGLQSCWDDAAFRAPGRYVPLIEWMRGHSRVLGRWDQWRMDDLLPDLKAYSRAFFGAPVNYRLRRIGAIQALQTERLLDLIRAGRSELIFAHLTCPHPPSMVANDVDRLDIFEAYVGNLEACDRLLGEVRTLLERHRPADGHRLVLTSDHWFRGLDWLDAGRPLVIPVSRKPTPFLLQIDERDDGAAHSTAKALNSRLLRDLLSQLAAKRAPSYSELRDWLENQPDGPTRLRSF